MNDTLIFVDPGHGGDDSGAVSGNIKESDLNLAIAGALRLRLFELGIHQISTRTYEHEGPALGSRVSMANTWKRDVDAFISIHCNGFKLETARGFEVIHREGSSRGRDLADEIYEQLNEVYDGRIPGRGVKTDIEARGAGLYVLSHTRMPAVIVECGFVTNPEDREVLSDSERQVDIAHAIAQGIINWIQGETR